MIRTPVHLLSQTVFRKECKNLYTYIIIDDEELTRCGTKEKLSSLSQLACCIGEAGNGEDGLQLVRTMHPDIVITDMKMPVLGGEKLLPVLSAEFPEIHIIVISGYQDFEYSRQAVRAHAIDYILKPFSADDILNAMKQTILRIQNASDTANRIRESEDYKESLYLAQDIRLLQRALQGYEHEDIVLTSTRLSFIKRSSFWYLFLLHAQTPLAEDEIQNFLSEHEYQNLCLYVSHNHASNMGYMLFFFPEQGSVLPALKHASQEISCFLQAQGISLSVGISQRHQQLCELNIASKEALQALNLRPVLSAPGICFFDEMTVRDRPAADSWPEEERLLFYIESGQTEAVRNLTKDFFDYYKRVPGITLGDLKYLCLLFANRVKSMLNYYVSHLYAFSRDTNIQHLMDTMFTFTELEEYYLQFFSTVAKALASDNVYSDGDIVNNVKTYMERNYSNDITVEFVASLFHMNRSYLSHIFKQKQGMAFKEYLNLLRLQHAKELLLHTDRKLYQISSAVGYDNVRSLYRVFKKFEHTTPEQFREDSIES